MSLQLNSGQVLEQFQPDDAGKVPLAVSLPRQIDLSVVGDTSLIGRLHQGTQLPPGPATLEPERDRLPECHGAILPEGGVV